MASRCLLLAVLAAAGLSGCDLKSLPNGATDPGGGVDGFADAGVEQSPECRTCHGDEGSSAPPQGLSGETDPSERAVGAHRRHLDPSPTWHAPMKCEACHAVPQSIDAPGHMDGDNEAEVVFGDIAANGGSQPSWNGESCSGVYCHGASLSGGGLTEPTWTRVDGSQDQCGNCHGAPPPPPHPEDADCGGCHPTIQPGTTTFRDPESHMNGRLEVGDGTTCDSCHGGGGVSAPPADLDGNTARTAPGVGAHRQHLGPSDWHREIACSSCHQVPATVDAPGHMDGDDRAEIPFDGFNPQASYDAQANTCQNLYCHGDARGQNGTMTWTADVELTCTSCHPTDGGLGGEHGEHLEEDDDVPCAGCHQDVVNGAMTIVGAPLHLNGQRDVSIATGGTFDPGTRRCTNLACHEDETW